MQIINNTKKILAYNFKSISNSIMKRNNSFLLKSHKKFSTNAVNINTKLLDKINLETSKKLIKMVIFTY